ncbi:MAG TPA: plastocyanin/azurin family copper-binding protein [Nitrososphaera sp.]|jgi:plastocyanin
MDLVIDGQHPLDKCSKVGSTPVLHVARSAVLIIFIVIAAALGIGYYIFFNPHEPISKPLSADIQPAIIRIVEGASNENNPEYMVPQVATVVIGVNNTVRWINEDYVPHTIASDSSYRDPVSGAFDSRGRPSEEGGAFIMPGMTYEFTFTQPGRIDYHHEPHPWVQGTIIALDTS